MNEKYPCKNCIYFFGKEGIYCAVHSYGKEPEYCSDKSARMALFDNKHRRWHRRQNKARQSVGTGESDDSISGELQQNGFGNTADLKQLPPGGRISSVSMELE